MTLAFVLASSTWAAPATPLLQRETVPANTPQAVWTRCVVYSDHVTVDVRRDGTTEAPLTRPLRFTQEVASVDAVIAFATAARAAAVSPSVPAPTDMADVRDDLLGPSGVPDGILRRRASGQENLSEEGRTLVRFLDTNCAPATTPPN